MPPLSTSGRRTENRSQALQLQTAAPGNLPCMATPLLQQQVGTDVLSSLPLLRDLKPDAARQLAEGAALRRLARHAMVIEQGSREAGLYILLKGQAQMVRHNQRGRALVIDQLRPGDHFGELSAIDDQPQYASVRCTMPSEVLVISRTNFIDCLHDAHGLLPALLKVMVQRVRRKNRRITLLALHDVRGCVVQQLLDLSELQDGQPVVRGRISRQAIADMIGASRAMVSRVMMALTRSGEVQILADGSTAIHCQADAGPGAAHQPRQRTAASGCTSPG